jgi:hypothetical protein
VTKHGDREGLKIARLLMVLSSVSPLFIFWAIRGSALIADRYFLAFCAVMVLVPNVFLWVRIRTAKKNHERRELTIGKFEDHRDHLLVYLFAMLLPFYAESLAAWRSLASCLAALAFIIFVFWHLNLHYMNVGLALLGYRVFTLYPVVGTSPFSGRATHVLITRRVFLATGERIAAYRLSDTVYLEVNE